MKRFAIGKRAEHEVNIKFIDNSKNFILNLSNYFLTPLFDVSVSCIKYFFSCVSSRNDLQSSARHSYRKKYIVNNSSFSFFLSVLLDRQ